MKMTLTGIYWQKAGAVFDLHSGSEVNGGLSNGRLPTTKMCLFLY